MTADAVDPGISGQPAPAPPAAPSRVGTGPRTPTRSGRRALWIATVAIAVVVVVFVAGLVTGVIPGLRTSTGNGHAGEQLTYNQAAPLADAAAAEAPGGPWTPFVDEGVNSQVAWNWAAPDACLFGPNVPQYLSSARPSIPSDGGSFATGAFSWWSFLYSNGTVNARNYTNVLDVGVVNGSAVAIATFTTDCYLGTTVAYPLPAMADVNSSAAEATAMALNRTFFSTYPELNVTANLAYFVAPEVPAPGWTWLFEFTSCPLINIYSQNTTEYPGVSYAFLVNATTGTADPNSSSPSHDTCSGPSDGG